MKNSPNKKKIFLIAIVLFFALICQKLLSGPKNLYRFEVILGIKDLPPINDPTAPRQGPSDNILLAFAEGRKIPNRGTVISNSLAVCMRDEFPDAEHHLLILPKERIESIRSLKPGDIPLLEAMKTLGFECLQKDGGDVKTAKLEFHRPPFNSQDHLHLHVISGTPTFRGALELPIFEFNISIDETIRYLQTHQG